MRRVTFPSCGHVASSCASLAGWLTVKRRAAARAKRERHFQKSSYQVALFQELQWFRPNYYMEKPEKETCLKIKWFIHTCSRYRVSQRSYFRHLEKTHFCPKKHLVCKMLVPQFQLRTILLQNGLTNFDKYNWTCIPIWVIILFFLYMTLKIPITQHFQPSTIKSVFFYRDMANYHFAFFKFLRNQENKLEGDSNLRSKM